jgi:hypothetical protein
LNLLGEVNLQWVAGIHQVAAATLLVVGATRRVGVLILQVEAHTHLQGDILPVPIHPVAAPTLPVEEPTHHLVGHTLPVEALTRLVVEPIRRQDLGVTHLQVDTLRQVVILVMVMVMVMEVQDVNFSS